MVFYIKEWPDGHATLMTDTGTVLWTFASVGDAQSACHDWYNIHEEDLECYTDLQEPLSSTVAI